jgi:hypothetical protein
MTGNVYDVAVVGLARAEQRLAKAGVTNVVALDNCDLSESVFDEATHTWSLPTCRAHIVVTDQIRSGRENLAPYLGVVVHGAPNYFMVTGPSEIADAQLNYIAECLKLMRRTGSTRIEVLFSTQRTSHLRGTDKADRADRPYWQRMAKLAPTAFDLNSDIGVADEVYDGAAIMRVGDDERRVRVRLSGRLDPIDGRYHWQGTVFGAPDEMLTQQGPVALTIGERTSECRITERTQQRRHAVAGVGPPPYALDDVEVVLPSR